MRHLIEVMQTLSAHILRPILCSLFLGAINLRQPGANLGGIDIREMATRSCLSVVGFADLKRLGCKRF